MIKINKKNNNYKGTIHRLANKMDVKVKMNINPNLISTIINKIRIINKMILKIIKKIAYKIVPWEKQHKFISKSMLNNKL